MLAQAVSNIPRERSQLKFKNTNNCLRVQTGPRGITRGKPAVNASLSKNHLLSGETQKRIWCSPTASFKDKPKCSPNKIITKQFTLISAYLIDSGLQLYRSDHALYISTHRQVLATHTWYYQTRSVSSMKFKAGHLQASLNTPTILLFRSYCRKAPPIPSQNTWNNFHLVPQNQPLLISLPPEPLSFLIRHTNKSVLKPYTFLSCCPLARPWRFFLYYTFPFSRRHCVLSPHRF